MQILFERHELSWSAEAKWAWKFYCSKIDSFGHSKRFMYQLRNDDSQTSLNCTGRLMDWLRGEFEVIDKRKKEFGLWWNWCATNPHTYLKSEEKRDLGFHELSVQQPLVHTYLREPLSPQHGMELLSTSTRRRQHKTLLLLLLIIFLLLLLPSCNWRPCSSCCIIFIPWILILWLDMGITTCESMMIILLALAPLHELQMSCLRMMMSGHHPQSPTTQIRNKTTKPKSRSPKKKKKMMMVMILHHNTTNNFYSNPQQQSCYWCCTHFFFSSSASFSQSHPQKNFRLFVFPTTTLQTSDFLHLFLLLLLLLLQEIEYLVSSQQLQNNQRNKSIPSKPTSYLISAHSFHTTQADEYESPKQPKNTHNNNHHHHHHKEEEEKKKLSMTNQKHMG